MNSRERVLAAAKCQPVDQVPFDFWAEPPTLERIYAHYGHRDLERILQEYEVDIRHVDAVTPPEQIINGATQNYWGERYVYKETEWGPVREDLPGALAEAQSLDDLKSFKWPSTSDFDYSQLKKQCDAFPDKAIMYGMADIWQRPSLVRGYENAFMDLALNPDWVHYLGRVFTDFYKEDYTRAQEEAAGRIDIFMVISDLGGQASTLISTDMFNEFIAPYLKELVDRIHELNAMVMFHSCGMVFPFIERLIETGVDILDPIQPVNPDMQPESLAASFKDRLCFHGGIDIQELLPNGNPGEIVEGVRQYIQTFGTNGGYICSPAHLFQPDAPPENIAAFYTADRKT